MKYLSRLFVFALASLAFVLVSCEKDDDEDDNTTEMAFEVSQAMLDASTVHVETVSDSKYMEFAHGGPAGFTSDSTIREIYSNNAAGLAYKTVITKRTYKQDKDGNKGDLLVTFAMVKKESGYNTEGGDWEWYQMPNTDGANFSVNPNGIIDGASVTKGKDMAGCISCHVKAPGGDFSFAR